MAISETAPADKYNYMLPPHTSRLLRVHTWPLIASKDANLRKAYITAPASCQYSPSAADDLQATHMAISSFEESHDLLSDEIVSSTAGRLLPIAEAETLSAAYSETPSDSIDKLQDIAPPCIDIDSAAVRRKGRKDVYLCYKDPHNWFPHHNNVLSPHLPFLFEKAISTRQKDMPTKIRLVVCEGTQFDLDAEVGDVMIFPEMVQYKGLTVSEIESFVEDVLVHERDWISGNREKIRGTYIFVQPLSCTYVSALDGADMTFNSLDGATLPEIFKSEAASRGLDGDHVVKSCLQIHGHKHHGNVIVYRSDNNGLYTESCWSSLVCYVSDVAVFIDMFSGKAKTIEEVLKRHVEQSKDASKEKQRLLQRGFPSLKTTWAMATLASLSVAVAVGTVVAFRLSKKTE